jgi:thiol-disulfide isomerase/thioredoxin
MKVFLMLISAGLNCLAATAQIEVPKQPMLTTTDTSNQALYLKDPKIPYYKFTALDSVGYYTRANLPQDTPVVFVYFNPGCEHCKTETEAIIKNIDRLKGIYFLFVSSADFNEVKDYEASYKLNSYPNIKVGWDRQYSFSMNYKVRFTPFVAVYKKNKMLSKVFEGGAKINELIAATK